MIYEGYRILKHRDSDLDASASKGDIDFVSHSDLVELVEKFRIHLSQVHFWGEFKPDPYHPFQDDRKKVCIWTMQSFSVILIEDIDRFDLLMEEYYEKIEKIKR